MANLQQFREFTNLTTILRAIWERDIQLESPVGVLFNQTDSNDASERTQGLQRPGLIEPYRGTLEYDESVPQERREFVHQEYARGLSIARALVDDGRNGVIGTMMRQFVEEFNYTVAFHQASVFNNAFSTTSTYGQTYVVADGRQLCTTTGRTTGKENTGNRGTSALTYASFVETRNLMRKFTDKSGNVVRCVPDTLVVPVELEQTALEIAQSAQRPDNANNANNPYQGVNVIVDPLLTDANNWWLVDSTMAQMHLWWWWRQRPQFTEDPSSDFNLKFRYRGYMRYSFGADDHTWIYGHEVA